MYNHLSRGWMALTLMSVGLIALTALVSFLYIGEQPLATRLSNKLRWEGTITLPENTQENENGPTTVEGEAVRSNGT